MNLKLSEFDFVLPEDLIADYPSDPRDESSLLVFKNDNIEITKFKNLLNYLPDKTVLIFNNTKVFKARLLFAFEGKDLEIFFLKSIDQNKFECMVKPGKWFKIGKEFILPGNIGAKVIDINSDGTRVIELNTNLDLFSYLQDFGSVPLPPYIDVDDTNAFEENYQTIYAKNFGSVAAPTAGLHFTDRLLSELKKNAVNFEFVELKVGLGTFARLDNENVEENVLHGEICVLEDEVAKRLNSYRSNGYKLISVGTTTLRTLQSAFLNGEFIPFNQETDIFIYPPFDNWAVDGLITNFHLPKSSLFILICAFIGKENAFKIYKHAINAKLRFYSFGDACLFLR